MLTAGPQKVAFRSGISDWLLSCQRLGERGARGAGRGAKRRSGQDGLRDRHNDI